jgi:hypothetical protein
MTVAHSEPMIPFAASWVLVLGSSTLVCVELLTAPQEIAEDGGSLPNIAAKRIEPMDTASLASEAIKPDRARRCLDERASGQPPLTTDTSQDQLAAKRVRKTAASDARSARSER